MGKPGPVTNALAKVFPNKIGFLKKKVVSPFKCNKGTPLNRGCRCIAFTRPIFAALEKLTTAKRFSPRLSAGDGFVEVGCVRLQSRFHLRNQYICRCPDEGQQYPACKSDRKLHPEYV